LAVSGIGDADGMRGLVGGGAVPMTVPWPL
jgi:hypothetical protein